MFRQVRKYYALVSVSRSDTRRRKPGIGVHHLHLVIARAASTATANTFDFLILLQLSAWHSADTSAVEIGLLRLDTSQTAQFLVALLLPLRDQVGIGVAVLQQPIVKLLRYGFLLVIEVIDIPRAWGKRLIQYVKMDEPQRA